MDKFIENLDLQSKGVWFPIVFGTILLAIVIFMRKKISWRQFFFIFGVIGYLTWMIDVLVYKTIDLFDLGNPKITGIGDIIALGIVPSCLAVMFLNYIQNDNRWRLVVLFSIISFLFEWGMIQVGYSKMKGWNPLYSIPVYLAMFAFVLPWILSFLGKVDNNNENPRTTTLEINDLFGNKEKAR